MSVHTDDSKERERPRISVKDGAEDISYRGEAPVPKDQRSDIVRLLAQFRKISIPPATINRLSNITLHMATKPEVLSRLASKTMGAGRQHVEKLEGRGNCG